MSVMEFLWKAPDGVSLRCEKWTTKDEARAAILFLHGMNGCANDFEPVGEALRVKGISSFALNLRGQGLDPAPADRGMDLNLERIEKDIGSFLAFVIKEVPGKPVFLAGESMGALISLWLAATSPVGSKFAGAILSVPVVALKKPTPPFVQYLLQITATVWPRLKFSPAKFVTSKGAPLQLTHDTAWQDQRRQGEQHVPIFSVRFLWKLGMLITSSFALAPEVKIPVLVLAAGKDVFVHVERIEEWFAQVGADDKTLHIYRESCHLLWWDIKQEQVLRDIEQWLEARINT